MAVNVLPGALPLDSKFVQGMRIDEDLFEELVLALKSALGPSSGLTSDDVDVTFLTRLMKLYDSRDRSWAKYAFGDASRGYTRNLVDEGNGKSNLVSHLAFGSIGPCPCSTKPDPETNGSLVAGSCLVSRQGQSNP